MSGRNKKDEVVPQEETASEKQEQNKEASPKLTERQLKKLAKRKSKDRKRELKHILLGSYFTLDDGRMASGGGKWISPLGVGDGAGHVLLLGIKDKRYRYNSRFKRSQQALYAAAKAMGNIGRSLALECAPDAVSCYIKSVLFRPVVLIFEEVVLEDGSSHLELHAYCGRSLFSFLSVRRAVSQFDKELPDNLSRV